MEPAPPPPPPPGVSPIKLKECIEELLKFTLLSSTQGKIQTGLSDEYCDGLFRDDPSNPIPINNDGLQTIEGRCATGYYKRIQSGHLLLFNKCLILEVQDLRYYASFHEMMEMETLAKVLPGVPSIEEGVQIYRNFYSEEKERSNGVNSICVTKPTPQLYVIMASILSGLSCGGVQKLLGFVGTIGTNPELLPPSTSTLLSTFLATHNPQSSCSTLTNSARALSKHINRSSHRYWGALN